MRSRRQIAPLRIVNALDERYAQAIIARQRGPRTPRANKFKMPVVHIQTIDVDKIGAR